MAQPNRVALITGGGTGIGAAAAKHFANQGTAVADVGRRLQPLDETVQVIRSEGGVALAIPADLAEASAPAKIIEATKQEWDRLDVLVNNAAAIKHFPIQQVTRELFEEHIAVNVLAPYFLVQAALPYLEQAA